jgi:hypothetical protein
MKNNFGENDTNYMASEDRPEKKKGRFVIMNKENRTVELYVGRIIHRLEPYGQAEVDFDFINHPDFKQQEKYFAVKEL